MTLTHWYLPQLGKREELQGMHPLGSFIPLFLESVSYKRCWLSRWAQCLGCFSGWAHTGEIKCVLLGGFCSCCLDHSSESRMPLELPCWLAYLRVAWKFWGHRQLFGILQGGVNLQLDPQWHFEIPSGPGDTVFSLPVQPNAWSVETDLF